MMDNISSYLSFETGITNNKVFAHRGDIFICDGVFKEISEINKDDHILGKPTRPVLIISEDEYNKDIVKVLPFSSKPGSENSNSVTSLRCIKVPGINNNPNPEYIDVSQIFTVNNYQLKVKIGEASQEIVDAAVALHTLQNVNENSMNTLIKIFKDRFPNAQAFKQGLINVRNTNNKVSIIDNLRSPFETVFTDVKKVSLEELISDIKHTLKEPVNKNEAYQLYQEWLNMGTDLFRNKYGLSKQQYYSIRDKCVTMMLGKIANFKKYDWSC